MHIVVPYFNEGTLNTIRCLDSLKKMGVKIWLVGSNKNKGPAYYSNIPDRKYLYKSGESLGDKLVEIAKFLPEKPTLMLTIDHQLIDVMNKREEIEKHYKLLLPSNSIIETFLDKTKFNEIALQYGFNVPKSVVIGTFDEFEIKCNDLKYPLYVKPYLTKTRLVHNKSDCITFLKSLSFTNYKPHIIQESIDGADDTIYSCYFLFDKEGNTRARFCARKLRQRPVGAGIGTLLVSDDNKYLLDLSEEFLRSIKYTGYCSIEYKFDKNSNSYFIIEPTVGRFEQNITISKAIGINIPEIYYNLLNGGVVEYQAFKSPVYYINEYRDFISKASSRGRNKNSNGHTYRKIFSSIHVRDYFNPNDPVPMVMIIWIKFKSLIKRLSLIKKF